MATTFQLPLLLCTCCTIPSQLFSQQQGVNGFTVCAKLDLADVAKFNFAFLANNVRDGYAELYIYHVTVDRYSPLR